MQNQDVIQGGRGIRMSPQQLAALTALASPPGGAPDMDEVNAADMATHSGPAHNGGPTSYSPDMSDASTRGSVPRSSSARWPTRPPALLCRRPCAPPISVSRRQRQARPTMPRLTPSLVHPLVMGRLPRGLRVQKEERQSPDPGRVEQGPCRCGGEPARLAASRHHQGLARSVASV
jgi:hypothetical protein